MGLPTAREIELETLLRQKDAEVSDLTDEVTRLRQYLSTQPGPSTADPITLPPALISILLPHINNATREPASTSTSSTVTTALTQRARLLQEENDELYDILKKGETGKLKEEVRGLRRVVNRLEGALQESHQVIVNLSSELDKSYDSFSASNGVTNNTKSYSRSPVNRSSHPQTAQASAYANSNGNGAPNSKIPPTGPRAYKKPRLSEPPLQASPSRSVAPLPSAPSHSQIYPRERSTTHTRDRRPRDANSPSSGGDPRGKSNYANRKMAVDEDSRKRPRSPALERELDRDRDRDRDTDRLRDRERERERERERDRLPRRNGSHSGGGRRGVRGGTPNSGSGYGNADRDRTLAERMGLSAR